MVDPTKGYRLFIEESKGASSLRGNSAYAEKFQLCVEQNEMYIIG